jgi:arabinogalactan endo-1,4-beta-galactosidase
VWTASSRRWPGGLPARAPSAAARISRRKSGQRLELATRYDKDLLVAETGYPWRLPSGEQAGDLHDEDSAVDLAKLPDARHYPPTPTGQVDYFHALREVISEVPGGRGRGFFAWEPGWLPGVGAWPGGPALLADAAMFDHSGRMLPVVTTAFA